MLRKIAIIGAGEIGQAIIFLLRNANNIKIAVWDIDPLKIKGENNISSAVSQAEIVFLCVPSWATRSAAKNLVPLLDSNTAIISLAKGIEHSTGKFMSELLSEIFLQNRFALLHGPMLAEELMLDLAGAAVIGANDSRVFLLASDLFAGSKLKLEYSDDVHGVAFAGVLKNIYSLGMGMISALEFGSNFTGWYVSQATVEMSKILQQAGHKQETAYSSAGLGDLLATGMSPYSNNHQIGRELAERGSTDRKGEGFVSLPLLVSKFRSLLPELPLANGVHQVATGKLTARESFAKFFEN